MSSGSSSGVIDRNTIGGLINSISRLIHLVACQSGKAAFLKDFRSIVGILKLLRPMLDEAFDCQIPPDKRLIKAFEELDVAVNEAREFLEKRTQKMSKICSVLRSESLVLKVQEFSVKICHELLNSSSNSVYIERCMQDIQCTEQDLISELIEVALKDQRENVIPSLEDIIKIVTTLGLKSNQELLLETISLEKERARAEIKQKVVDVDYIDQIIMLVTHIRYCMAKLEQFGVKNGLHIPSYFCCPLSLELMFDPVILSSGQTYERSFIQKWIDNGLTICPKTRQSLAHTNLVPNFTVKAMIAKWCKENNIGNHNSLKADSVTTPFLYNVALEEFSPGNSFHWSLQRDSTSRSSIECISQPDQHQTELSSVTGGEGSFRGNNQGGPNRDSFQGIVPFEQQNCCHSRTESVTSVITSIEISSKFDKVSLLEDFSNPASILPNNNVRSSPFLPPDQICTSNNGNNNGRSQSIVPIWGLNDTARSSHVEKLVKDINSLAPEVQTGATLEIRLLAKNNIENRLLIAKCGAIVPLVSLMYSKTTKVQENAVTALLNLSLSDSNKISIVQAGAIEPLIYVLGSGNAEARENSAATLYSLSALEEYKIEIGSSGAVQALVNLLGFGSLRGKKDAATALFSLSILHDNKARIVQAGAVKYLVELMDPSTGMVDKSVALVANLSTIPEGRLAITQEGGIPLLVEIVETGSQRGKENAASTLLQLCVNSYKHCSLILQEGAVPPLITLSQFGTPRAKEKAQQILSHFRGQRKGISRKIRP